MDRRAFIGALAGLAATTVVRASQTRIGPQSPMGVPYMAWVQRPALIRQQCPQWCWAASISMIFASHGHFVDQTDIVQKTYGRPVCVTSGNPISIARNLASNWVDSRGQPFSSRLVAAYDYYNGVQYINNAVIVNELTNDRPLLYCNTHHAMVVVSATYYATPAGPNIQTIGVMDPWPASAGFHTLSASEMLPATQQGGEMTFLAASFVT